MPALNDWSSKTDEQVFGGVHEQDGSQYAYWRDIEIKRRLYLLQKQSLDAQIAATEAQRQATAAQEKALFRATGCLSQVPTPLGKLLKL